jgi:hypothetical protein
MPRQFKLGREIPTILDDSEVTVPITAAAKDRSSFEFHEREVKNDAELDSNPALV